MTTIQLYAAACSVPVIFCLYLPVAILGERAGVPRPVRTLAGAAIGAVVYPLTLRWLS